MNEEYKEATGIGSVTLVGVDVRDGYPIKRGNCFSVGTKNKNEWYHILNFSYENLKYLEKQKIIQFPIKILSLSERHAVICDNRIPDEFYQKDFCEICTPRELLPVPQRLKQLIQIQNETRKEHENGLVSITFPKTDKTLELKTRWKAEIIEDQGYVYAPYVPVIRRCECTCQTESDQAFCSKICNRLEKDKENDIK